MKTNNNTESIIMGYAISMKVGNRYAFVFNTEDIENDGFVDIDPSWLFPTKAEAEQALSELQAYCEAKEYINVELSLEAVEADPQQEDDAPTPTEMVVAISNQYGVHTRIRGTRTNILKQLRTIALDKRKASRQAHRLPTDVMALGAAQKTGNKLVDMATFEIKQKTIAELLDLLNAHGIEKYTLKEDEQ